jgi:hypothetical protein
MSPRSEATSLIDGTDPYTYEQRSAEWLENLGIKVWIDALSVKDDGESRDITLRGKASEEFHENSTVIVTVRKNGIEVFTIRSVDLYNLSFTLNEGVSMNIYITLFNDLHGVKAGHYEIVF